MFRATVAVRCLSRAQLHALQHGAPVATADLCDWLGDDAQYLELQLRRFGRRGSVCGPVFTAVAGERGIAVDNTHVKATFGQECPAAEEWAADGLAPLEGVLVVDAFGSMQRAVIGDMIAASAAAHHWAGAVVHGCIRDSSTIDDTIDVGLFAMGTTPRKTARQQRGSAGGVVEFGNVTFRPGEQWVFADADGVVVVPTAHLETVYRKARAVDA